MKTAGAWLLIDNSNTRTKFALACEQGICEVRMLLTGELTPESIRELVSSWCFDSVCLCSVVPAAATIIEESFSAYSFMRLAAQDIQRIDFTKYPGIQTLGADRVANSLAALQHAPLPLVAVDLGTATTFDVLVQGAHRACFAGGVIAPGMKAFSECLPGCTAQLPPVEQGLESPVIGRTTQEAMAAAVNVGYAGMVDALIDGIEQQLGESVHVLLTGGDAEAVAPRLKHAAKVVPGLTLQGIAMAAGLPL